MRARISALNITMNVPHERFNSFSDRTINHIITGDTTSTIDLRIEVYGEYSHEKYHALGNKILRLVENEQFEDEKIEIDMFEETV